jgi:putative FmdB family regulatory protein
MPIYEYQCESCGHHLEALQKVADKPLRKCPDCGKPKLKRLLSAPMFLLKGSGWYETDFKSDKEEKRNLADRPEKEETKPAAASEVSADAKAAAKPEAKPKPEGKVAAADATRAAPAKKIARSKAARKAGRRPA